MKWSLRARILIPTVALMLTTTLTLCIASFVASRAAVNDGLAVRFAELSQETATAVESFVASQNRNVDLWSRQASTRAALATTPEGVASRQQVNVEFADAVKTHGCFQNLLLIDLKGDTVASSDPATIGTLNISDRQYFKEAITGKSVISEVLASKTDGAPVVVVASPVMNGAHVLGLVVGSLDMHEFTDLEIANIKVLDTGYAYLADDKGLVFSHPDKNQIMNLKLSEHDWGTKILAGRKGLVTYTFNGIEKYAFFQRSERFNWIVVITAPRAEFDAPAYRIGKINLLLGAIVIIAGVGIMLYAVKLIARPILAIADQLSAGADQTASAATQVSGSSQSLAQGVSEQAASLEETSASLEEVASMTKSNADHAQKAKELSNQTRAAADHGTQDMEAMKKAMAGITASSNGISKIIKTIDEIAFQTNILALNAAVEAARAGEAGAGFAVVADEVRSLAQRSAQSAKETAEKIQEAIERSEDGAKISSKVAESLNEIVAKAREVDVLVAEIATASLEQKTGLGQVNIAVSQMEKVTQNNAANAEESAAAAEELSAQSLQMHEMIGKLDTLITGQHNQNVAGRSVPHVRPSPGQPSQASSTARPAPRLMAVG